jgi:hypothetical protein
MRPEGGIQERRAAKRYPFKVVIAVQELSPEHKTAMTTAMRGVSRDASNSGLCLSTDTPLTYSSVVRCEITVADSPVSIPTMAQVRWVKTNHGGKSLNGLTYIL